ncbi:hypothetical protein F5Y06DRAFT_266133 [Hypoxylon sp. FL0890]|nr:hypothetical protein F5Y06DRAFT_266133 [Hypoxylon sp. FL0890]
MRLMLLKTFHAILRLLMPLMLDYLGTLQCDQLARRNHRWKASHSETCVMGISLGVFPGLDAHKFVKHQHDQSRSIVRDLIIIDASGFWYDYLSNGFKPS